MSVEEPPTLACLPAALLWSVACTLGVEDSGCHCALVLLVVGCTCFAAATLHHMPRQHRECHQASRQWSRRDCREKPSDGVVVVVPEGLDDAVAVEDVAIVGCSWWARIAGTWKGGGTSLGIGAVGFVDADEVAVGPIDEMEVAAAADIRM